MRIAAASGLILEEPRHRAASRRMATISCS